MEETNIELFAVENPVCSTDDVWRDDNMEQSLSDDLDTIEANIAALQSGKADVNHTHTGYASQSDLDLLEDIVDTKAEATHTHSEYASVSHSHDDYATVIALDTLGSELDSKADVNHIHSGYASSSHTHSEYADANHNHSSDYASLLHSHDNYVTTTSFDALENEVSGKADVSHSHSDYSMTSHTHSEYSEVGHSHSNYSETTHNHDSVYSLLSHTHAASEIGAAISGHNHDDDYADINHNHDGVYANLGHNHNEDYATIDHAHTDYATTTALDEVSAIVAGKSSVSHSHDDVYYTETEIDTKLATKADSSHSHDGVYDASGSAASALTSANAYTDSKIDALVGEGASTTLDTIGEISSAIEDNQDAIDLLNAAIANKANVTDLNSHANDTEIHITNVERNVWNAKSDFSGNYNDLTNKPSIPSIDGLATEDYVDEKIGSVTVESIGALPNTTVIPIVPTNVSAFTNDAGYLTEHQSLDGLATETYVNTRIDAIDIPSALSDLTTDSTHRLVTDVEKAAWNAKSDFSGSYNDLTDKPSIPSISGLATETYVDEAVSTKADSGHTHGDIYYTETEIDSLLDTKANSNHNHNSAYDAFGTAETKANAVQANLDVVSEDLAEHIDNADIHFTAAERTKLSGIANNANNYTLPSAGTALGGVKTGGDVTITSGVITVNDDSHNHIISNIDGLQSALDAKASSSHNHDDAYYTETEVDTLLSGKANTSHTHSISNVSGLQSALDAKSATTHNHDTSYDAKGSANSALTSAKAYTDELIEDEVANRSSAIATAKSSAISTAASDATTKANNALASAKTYADNAVATVKNDLLNNAGAAYDTLKELGDLIDDNADAIEALETVASGKANAVHTHAISDITNLQSTLDGKAASSHGTHVTYSTTAPVMDGTASVGSASTVARSDHKHPTDTSRAAQTSLDSHTSNKSNPHGVTLAQLGLTATASELNTLDGITATVTELNYVDGVTSNIQTQLNAKAASSHTHSYAGSSSVGGAATSANKLNTNAGDANTPVYFSNGIPVACTSLDLNTTGSSASCTGNAATATNVAWSGVTSKPSYYDAKAIKSITRSGTTFTYTCMDGSTGTFTQQDNNTTYSAVTTSANGLMSASDKSKLDGMILATVSEVETYLAI